MRRLSLARTGREIPHPIQFMAPQSQKEGANQLYLPNSTVVPPTLSHHFPPHSKHLQDTTTIASTSTEVGSSRALGGIEDSFRSGVCACAHRSSRCRTELLHTTDSPSLLLLLRLRATGSWTLCFSFLS